LNDIVEEKDKRNIFVHGIVNQDPGGKKNPIITFYDRGRQIPTSPDIIIPAAINQTLKFWQPELRDYSIAMVHSKVVVIDPFGRHPVVITGSHNLGPKASKENDDNMVIIENAAGLAHEYAVNIMSIYNQYKWRHSAQEEKWDGLVDTDDWEKELRQGVQWNEVLFWFGEFK
jgi:phosphatidylserine/phosphatidylglycerophosphate/cardiolipin synthase-like enzyme